MPERLNSPEPVLERLWSRQIYSLRSHSASKIRPQVSLVCASTALFLSRLSTPWLLLLGCVSSLAAASVVVPLVVLTTPELPDQTNTLCTGHTISPASEPSNSALFLSQAEQRSERQCGCTALQITDAFARGWCSWCKRRATKARRC